MAEPDVTPDLFDAVTARVTIILEISQAKHALGRGDSPLQVDIHIGQPFDGAEQKCQRNHVRGKGAGCDDVHGLVPGHEVENHREPDTDDQAYDRRAQRLCRYHAHVLAPVLIIDLVEL